jgi:hypothetical protein
VRDIAVKASALQHKNALRDAVLTKEPVPTLIKMMGQLASAHPLLSRDVLKDTLVGRFVQNRLGNHADPAVADAARQLVKQWRAGVEIQRLCTDPAQPDRTVEAASFTKERWSRLVGGGNDQAACGTADLATVQRGAEPSQLRVPVTVGLYPIGTLETQVLNMIGNLV